MTNINTNEFRLDKKKNKNSKVDMGNFNNIERICETCKYSHVEIFEEPCRSCFIPDPNNPDVKDNNNWESKE